MKRLVLVGEGHGEVSALPILARKIIDSQGGGDAVFVDREVIRPGNVRGVIKFNKHNGSHDFTQWDKYMSIAAKRSQVGGVLCIFDGDADYFPAGSNSKFCPFKAGSMLADRAKLAGAGTLFSFTAVFACKEYETWLIAGCESIVGRRTSDGRELLKHGVQIPAAPYEMHGKKWMEANFKGYRPTRDQEELTRLVDLDVIRPKNLRSFRRLENAVRQLTEAVRSGIHISTPAI